MFKYFYAAIVACVMLSCNHAPYKQTQQTKDSAQQQKIYNAVINLQQYQFIPQYANSATGRNRYITGFSFKISKTKIESYLPYFGVAYQADLGSNKSPFDFTSTNFTYSVTDRKKGGWDIIINVNDAGDFKKFYFNIFENGTASLQVTSNNRQSISYTGYVQAAKENETK